MTKEETQQKFLELQNLTNHIKGLQEQVVKIEQQKIELHNLNESLSEIKKVESGKDILTPLGAGIFIKTKVEDSKSVIMNVGANIMVGKSVEDAQEVIKEQVKELSVFEEQVNTEIRVSSLKVQRINEEVQQAQ